MQPFIAVDGEGGGRDETGRQNYLLLRAGTDCLFDNNRRLTSLDCFEFLLCLDPDAGVYVAYYFDYDTTMILRDVERYVQPGLKIATYWNGYLISYLPRKFLSICRAEWPRDEKRPKRLGKTITINDVGPFFQMSFHAALTKWEIGTPEELAKIAAGKAARDHFELMTPEIIEYNKIECDMLIELMTKFREVCADTGYLPARWQGPGWLAADMMKTNALPKRKEYEERYDETFWKFANNAYYGGRFEISRVGDVREPIYEYDINSAYPNAMRNLPCMVHGRWIETKTLPDTDRLSLFVSDLSFVYDENVGLCDFPIRDKTGTIYFPRQGRGWYWEPEIRAAIRRGKVKLTYHSVWRYEPSCHCTPFEYIEPIYQHRQSIGKSNRGFTLKLGLNAHYGKLCQSIGDAPYANPIWGGLITSYTRAALIDAYAQLPDDQTIMLATDGIYTLQPLDLSIGAGLGQWECKHHEHGMFFVQPGLYFYNDGGRPKTRGIPQIKVLEYETQFRTSWREYMENHICNLFGDFTTFPEVKIELTSFVGYRLAYSRYNPKSAGRWDTVTRTVSFDWRSKRDRAIVCGNAIATFPRVGSKHLRTVPYAKDIGKSRSLLLADQPDFFVFGEEHDWTTEAINE
jgi:hypothetical protein